jgi:hypothetical protein
VKLDLNYGGEEYHLDLTMSEQSILVMLRFGYNTLESLLQQALTAGSGKAPFGAIEDAMVLIRCMTNNRLEEHKGKILRITRLRGKTQ